jgi:hypothetical protein
MKKGIITALTATLTLVVVEISKRRGKTPK